MGIEPTHKGFADLTSTRTNAFKSTCNCVNARVWGTFCPPLQQRREKEVRKSAALISGPFFAQIILKMEA